MQSRPVSHVAWLITVYLSAHCSIAAADNPPNLPKPADTSTTSKAAAPQSQAASIAADKWTAKAKPDEGVGKTPAQDKKGAIVPEYKRRRWSLTPGGSQRMDWLTGTERFDWPSQFNAKTTLGLPSWLNATLEYRARYETLDNPFVKGQKGSQYQVPMQTVLWVEANYKALRVGFEFWDARQYGTKGDQVLNTTMVDAADFSQIYAALSTRNLMDSGLDFEVKGGRMTLDLGSRRLVARNAFRNTTNAFTGLSFTLRDNAGAWQVQVFGSQPVVRLPDQKSQLVHNDYAWDDEQKNAVFTGFIAETHTLPWDTLGELYFYYLGEDPNSINYRRLFTPGLRLYRQPKKGEFDFEGETVGQAGSRLDTFYAANGKGTKQEMAVHAFYEHIQLGYTFDLPWNPRLLVQYDYATGGASGNGGTSYSFDTLFGARRWEYGPTGIFGPFSRNNINAPGTRLFLVPHRDVATFIAYRAWWMADSQALWQPANLISPSGKAGDFMGHTLELSARWDAYENIALEGGYACLFKGGFARNAPGAPANHDNVNYFYVQTQLRF